MRDKESFSDRPTLVEWGIGLAGNGRKVAVKLAALLRWPARSVIFLSTGHLREGGGLSSSRLSRRPDRQLQYLAKRRQVRISWSNVIGFPKIDACRADAHLFGNFGNR